MTTLTLQVREATPTDVATLAPMAAQFFAASVHVGAFHAEHWIATWGQLIARDHGAILLVESDGAILGALGVLRFADPNTGQQTAQETFWYVRPDVRGGGAGKLLMARLESWATEHQCAAVLVSRLDDPMGAQIDTWYRQAGYSPLEMLYLKGL